MPSRPGWSDKYWKTLDKEQEKKLRTSCPRCGSSHTYYNPKFKVWCCARCENSFPVKGVKGADEPWWRRLFKFGRGD